VEKIKVGITGQAGFIGTHLVNYLKLKTAEIELVPFEDSFFQNEEEFSNFVIQCDKIVHLAAMNRGKEKEIYNCNVNLVKKLIASLESNKCKPHIFFASSIQESKNNAYGRSKKEGRKLLEKWADKSSGSVTSLIIPNVYGCFGRPFYNSVISTFCYQLTHNMKPKIEVDTKLPLIYINDLVKIFYQNIINPNSEKRILHVKATTEQKVSQILCLLKKYKDLYLKQNIVPELNSYYEVSLFNVFRSYVEYDFFPVQLKTYSDKRGSLFEIIKSLNGGQIFLSTTKPGIIRGNHYHTRKIERFCVIQGEAVIRLRRIGARNIIKYKVSGNIPAIVDIPIFHTHNIENIGKTDLVTIFWSNELFDPNDPDTFFEKV